MQEAIPVNFTNEMPEIYRAIGRRLKWILVTIWNPIRWLLDAMLTEHPAQKYIDEQRAKGMRFAGHFW